MKDLVSIVVPIYNSEETLEDTLDSLVSQTYEKIEIILINDGSTDGSLELCQAYKEKDNRIKLYTQKNKGVSAARNYGIQESRGTYIVFVDSDDLLNQSAIIELIDIQEEEKSDLIVYNIAHFSDIKTGNENLQSKKYSIDYYSKDFFFENELSKYIENEKINSPCNKMYKVDILKKKNIFFDENISLAEDLLFNFKYLQTIQNVVIYSKELYYYRVDQQNTLTTKFNEHKYDQLIRVNDLMKSIAIENGDIHLLPSLNKIRIKNIYSVIRDYLENDKNKLENEKNIKKLIEKEYKKTKLIKKDPVYLFLQIILYSKNYKMIIFITKLINLIP